MCNLVDYVAPFYAEPHRRYHTLGHIRTMFGRAGMCGIELTQEQVVAIFFHDIVYSVPVGACSNEETSAQMAIQYCNQYDIPNIDTIATIIRDTETHIPSIEESEVVIDLDLWGLSDNTYWTNGVLIHEEMLIGMSELEYMHGKRKWLKSMLDRDKIYVSDIGDPLMEVCARGNLEHDLDMMGFLDYKAK